jgi:phosphoribosylformimino-5-aminoimidazole carboxamide ribotide isomerase
MIELIPALDIIEGKCVRLTQGDYEKKTVYNENPLEIARQFEDIGLSRLHLVDLDGARKGQVVNLKVLDSICNKTKLCIDFGGGIKTDEDLERVFNAGASLAAIGSIAVKNKDLFFSWITKYGADKLFLGADVKDEKIVVSGWKENTDISVFDFIKENYTAGIHTIFCTDVAKDGMLEGASVELYKKIIESCPKLNLVASGGVSSIADISRLNEAGCKAVIIGKAIYEGKVSIAEMRKFLM